MRKVTCLYDGTSIRVCPDSVHAVVERMDSWKTRSVPRGEIHLLFAGETLTSNLHARFFGDPEVTDVMTFPGDVEEDWAGEIVICPEYARRVADSFGNTQEEEILLYLIHGWLHLSGMEDQTEGGEAAMRKAEREVLEWLNGTCLKLN